MNNKTNLAIFMTKTNLKIEFLKRNVYTQIQKSLTHESKMKAQNHVSRKKLVPFSLDLKSGMQTTTWHMRMRHRDMGIRLDWSDGHIWTSLNLEQTTHNNC